MDEKDRVITEIYNQSKERARCVKELSICVFSLFFPDNTLSLLQEVFIGFCNACTYSVFDWLCNARGRALKAFVCAFFPPESTVLRSRQKSCARNTPSSWRNIKSATGERTSRSFRLCRHHWDSWVQLNKGVFNHQQVGRGRLKAVVVLEMFSEPRVCWCTYICLESSHGCCGHEDTHDMGVMWEGGIRSQTLSWSSSRLNWP